MSSELMRQTADVLEKLADWLDTTAQQQQAEKKAERRKVAQQISEKYAAATGEELPAQSVEKIASSDEDLVAILTKIAERAPQGETPDAMGNAEDPRDNETATQKRGGQEKIAGEDVDRRFVDWIMS